MLSSWRPMCRSWDKRYAITEEERITLQERVARLESLQENKLQVASAEHHQDARSPNLFPTMAEASNIGTQDNELEHQASFVSILDETEVKDFNIIFCPNEVQ